LCSFKDNERVIPWAPYFSQGLETLSAAAIITVICCTADALSGIQTAQQNVFAVSKANRQRSAGKGNYTVCRLLLVIVACVAVLVSTPFSSTAQDVNFAALPGTADTFRDYLSFSKDGRFLREVVPIKSAGADEVWHVRAITYVPATGKIRRVWNLQPHTTFFSATTDGRILVISVDRDLPEAHAHVFLFDTETGSTQDIPSSWFAADDPDPDAAISGDGRLVSAFSDWGPDNGALVVSVYNWSTKRLVAKQATGYPAGGYSSGSVTVDGKIEFFNNRAGANVVDPKTGRLLISAGPNSLRSEDGAWVVEFPNSMIYESLREVIIKNGSSGKVVGNLDLQITDDKENWEWGRGAFCGTSGRFIVANNDTVQAFEIPSGKKIADVPKTTWQDADAVNTDRTVTIACSPNGKDVAIRSGVRLTLHNLN
jgi:hypothetical protein